MTSRSKLVILVAIVLIVAISVSAFYEIGPLNTKSVSSSETVLYQTAPYAPLTQGAFDGNITYAQLEKYGDFGLGTFNGLGGEMVALNGSFYQIKTDGVPRQVDPTMKTPYALVTFFKADQSLQISQTMNYSQLTGYIDQNLPSLNSIYAIKIHVTCQYAETRSESQLSPPYPSLSTALANETVFNLTNVTGTIVGFRFPDYLNGASTSGYHFHFITDNKMAGGHLFNCTITSGTVQIDKIDEYVLMIP